MPQPITRNIQNDDLSARFQETHTVGGSPATNAETIIATLTLAGFNDLAVMTGVQLVGWAAFTAGTSGVSATLQIKQTDTSGTAKGSTGAVTVAAADLYALEVVGFDATPAIAKYVLTLTIGSGAAESTVSACSLRAVVI